MVEALILVDPCLLYQGAVEAFDVAVAFGMVVSGAAVVEGEPVEGFDVARRGELRAVNGGQGKLRGRAGRRASGLAPRSPVRRALRPSDNAGLSPADDCREWSGR